MLGCASAPPASQSPQEPPKSPPPKNTATSMPICLSGDASIAIGHVVAAIQESKVEGDVDLLPAQFGDSQCGDDGKSFQIHLSYDSRSRTDADAFADVERIREAAVRILKTSQK